METHGASMKAFYGLWIIGSHALLPIIAVVSMRMHVRPAAMINVCILWSITGILDCLLFHARWALPRASIIDVCAIQAALVFATTPACSAAQACLMYEVRTRMEVVADPQARDNKNLMIRQFAVIVIPYVVFVAYAVPGVITALNQFSHLPFDDLAGISLRRRFYCTVEHSPYTMSAGIGTLVLLIPPFVCQVQIIRTIWRNWTIFRKTASGSAELRFATRMVILFSYLLLAGGVSFSAAFLPMNAAPDIFWATCAICIAVFFATARDFWRTLRAVFVGRRRAEDSVAVQPIPCCPEPPCPV
ncbi:hypothetical protein AURDEDRAFT_111984 [Auricularia subglabra TFB-10046 SS5]|nr:hypothetical protein AURDEDRAFT_111984 [Auricularia subglabra TFB-10046 SS5]